MRRFLLCGLLLAIGVSASSLNAQLKFNAGTPKDSAIANQERILYWLEKNGQVKRDSSDTERKAVLDTYLNGALKADPLSKSMDGSQAQKYPTYKQSPRHSRKANGKTTAKVLAVLIDFPDLKHDANGLTHEDTDMYYPSYPVSHYRSLLFSDTGFNSNSGRNLISARQYYEKESGGTFDLTGDVYGWVRADNKAAHYGANSEFNGADRNVVSLVTEAVEKAVAKNRINLSEYDISDPYDFDRDGDFDEADGIIDHVMVFHSSIGEEVGGGYLGSDAIWSHRYFVGLNTRGSQIPGTDKKVFGYTIQPIDAATGIVVHEFGHVLGLRDEYDTSYSDAGAPVGYWSVMADGTWAGRLAGTEPTGFSPYAKAYLQKAFGGNWVNEQVIDFNELSQGSQKIEIAEAVNSNTVNQLRIDMPKPKVAFAEPYAGKYQYYSGEGNNLRSELSFEASLPQGDVVLSMKGRWEMESDRDYARILVNGTPVSGNYTKTNNPYYSDIKHYISGVSARMSDSTDELEWVDLNYDLSAFSGQSVTIRIEYITDAGGTGFGLVIDELTLDNGTNLYVDGAEKAGVVNLNGFLRIDDKKPGKAQHYWVQLRSERGQDSGLKESAYSPGVLIWFANEAFSSNSVNNHPGYGFVGVVDTDQKPIMNGRAIANSSLQVSDAALSLYAQKSYRGDAHLQAETRFIDYNDYSLIQQPESGLVLPKHGLVIEVVEQSPDNRFATVKVSNNAVVELTADFKVSTNETQVVLSSDVVGGDGSYSYYWDFGDGYTSNAATPKHTYQSEGTYIIKLKVLSSNGEEVSVAKSITVRKESDNVASASTNNSGGSGGGGGSFTLWLLLLLSISLGFRRKS